MVSGLAVTATQASIYPAQHCLLTDSHRLSAADEPDRYLSPTGT
jgi:hypothetical protein